MLKAVYIVCATVESIVFVAGGAWLTYSGGSGWWVAGGIALAVLAGTGFARRVNSWGDLGTTDCAPERCDRGR